MSNIKSASVLAGAAFLIGGSVALVHSTETPAPKAINPVSRPALNVTAIQPVLRDIPLILPANGSIAAWQEAIVGAEVSDLRLKEVRVQVGDSVRKGQVLAVFADDSVLTDIAQDKATLAEAEANFTEARMNAGRAQQVASSGALSRQQIDQYLTGEKTAKAKTDAAKARLNSQLLRHRHTRVIASDDGIISSRSATLGAVATPGQELFRLLRQNRLEWRAEVTAAEMVRLKPGLTVSVVIPNVATVNGTVRSLAPTLDAQSRNGLIYVDLPNAAAHGLRAGMFAQGEFHLGSEPALTLPQQSLSLREGFSYVFKISKHSTDQAQVTQLKVQLGRRMGDYLEIISGIQPEDELVASGAAFLADGDSVRVVQP
ncbi:efflux RND transporter periplasmic adaptor subunit [Crenothrix polyspora]|uniref:Efflux transporter, RND family, MFP subunit n=1 Tax=Crenothrix polyspora TaxID=360316 RepID=A0A1R4HBB5_9GAMM|nr:efflux RND transporter periplasmic adaptor subunit [Crenothrix polyspora]SJM93552.1 Efflux transporter, RND family, MFP subunit [Crenothrix polyspora]